LSIDLSQLKFDSDGLIPAIVQDTESGEVLMMAFMNDEAIQRTLETGLTHFYSRSRRKLWQKGESSGHIQEVKEILYDCDSDCLLVRAKQEVAACHTGHRSCFFRTLEGQKKGEPVFDAEKVYAGQKVREIFDRLYSVILERQRIPREDSHTSRLLTEGIGAVGDKVMEEAAELAEAAISGEPEEIIHETADLFYHVLVLLAGVGVTPNRVKEELAERFGTGGLDEKASRKK
jgi:phosphoribosyl-ATP pyrophosphohydrolase/phosphoribosyl-AMP cyclohydrolase